jgi:hypothetical protein
MLGAETADARVRQEIRDQCLQTFTAVDGEVDQTVRLGIELASVPTR